MSFVSTSARVIAALALLSSVARADERGVGVGVTAGVGTPLGGLGIELSSRIAGSFALAGGLGYGPGGVASGLQGRLYRHRDRSGFYVGAGVSVSDEDLTCGSSTRELEICLLPREHGVAWWTNLELGYERRTAHAFVRGFIGYSEMMNPDGVCTSSDCLERVPYLGVAFGPGPALPPSPTTTPPPEPDEPVSPTPRQAAQDVLTDDARDAARHGRCDLVRAIDAELARAAPVYRARVFAADGTISACL